MTAFDPTTLVTVLLSAGGATFVGAAFKGIRSLQAGAKARDRDTVGSLREQRDESDDRARMRGLDSDFFRTQCGRLVFQLTAAGIEPEIGPDGLVPPSEKLARSDRVAAPSASRRGRSTSST